MHWRLVQSTGRQVVVFTYSPLSDFLDRRMGIHRWNGEAYETITTEGDGQLLYVDAVLDEEDRVHVLYYQQESRAPRYLTPELD